MKRLSRGTVVLAASVALWSCSGDPTASFRGGVARIDADPSSIFMTQGETKAVQVKVVDGQGNPLDEAVTVTPGTGLTVASDTTFLPTTATTGELTYARRYNVTANAGVATSIILSAGGVADTVPVRVLPLGVALTFSNATPAANEEVTVTAEGFSFRPEAVVIFGADTAPTVSVSEDGSSMIILPSPGFTGAPTISGVEVNYAPGASLTIPSTSELTVGPVTPLAGTAAPGTAPTIPLPAVGETSRFYDAPDFAASADAFYKITVPAGLGGVTVTLNWNSSADVDLIEGPLTCATLFTGCNFAAATSAKPESTTYTLTPGTYYLIAELFAGTAPTWIYLETTSEAPEAP
jgi:hypothetical protein